MKLIFVLFLIFGNCMSLNVGTVLFTQSDQSKSCWSMENIALLQSRLIIEDLLPTEETIRINCRRFIPDLIEYFHLIFDTTRKETYGRMKYLMLLATSDAIGGYLHHLIIPRAKAAYYAGQIDYDSINSLIHFYKQIKLILGTNGRGWNCPVKIDCGMLKGKPLVLKQNEEKCQEGNACQGLIYHQTAVENPSGEKNEVEMKISMPFFDTNEEPNAIAVPFKIYPLRNIESRESAFIIVKYYIACSKCMKQMNVSVNSRNQFQDNLMAFIERDVKTKFNDPRFYSAFGGVMRVYETLDKLDATPKGSKENKTIGVQNAKQISMPVSKEKVSKRLRFIFVCLLTSVFVWFLLGMVFICNRIKSMRKSKEEDGDSSSSQNSIKSLKNSESLKESPRKSRQSFKKTSISTPQDETDIDPKKEESAVKLEKQSELQYTSETSSTVLQAVLSKQLSELGLVEVPRVRENLSQKSPYTSRMIMDPVVMHSQMGDLPLRDVHLEAGRNGPFLYGYDYETTSTSDYSTD